MSGTPPYPIVDHLVILVSHATLLELPERLKDTFAVSPGGTHADGLTHNHLILFKDGFYIELIAFFDNVDPEARKKHRWGNLKENTIIDWAYTLPREDDFPLIQQRVRDADTALTYHDPVPGGRTRTDGVVLKWSISTAQNADGTPTRPGILPFWCLDRTQRHLRVPYEDNKGQTEHPSGVRGISHLRISVPKDELSALSRVYEGIHNGHGKSDNGDSWPFKTPKYHEISGKHVVYLAAEETESLAIKLTLQGGDDTPRSLEILPGLVFGVEDGLLGVWLQVA